MAHRVVSRQPGRPLTPRSGNRAARITNRTRRPGALRFARLGTQRGSCAPGTRASRRRKRVSGTPCLPRPRLRKAKTIVATTTTANARSACYTLERQSRETRARNVVHATTPRAPFLLYDTDSLAVWGSRITSSIQFLAISRPEHALEWISRDIEARRIEACPFDQRRHSSQHVVSRQSERPLTPRPARAQSAAGVLTTYGSTRPRPHAHMRPVARQDSSLATNHAQQNSELHNTHQGGRGAGCSSAFSARGRRHWNRCATKENALYLETLRVLVKPNLTDAIRPRRS